MANTRTDARLPVARPPRSPLAGAALLNALRAQLATVGPDAAGRKRVLLEALQSARLARARHVVELQRVACFLIAFPDDARVLHAAKALAGSLPDHVRRLPRT